jgi:hypothetical protein
LSGPLFLPGVDEAHVRDRLNAAGGDEIGSGKFAHPESSAALAANAFGWFVRSPHRLPPLAGTAAMGTPLEVSLEFSAPFPWPAGRHPWLDAVVITPTHLIGVESKRYEPFRDAKPISFSSAYDRPVWGDRMAGYCSVRDALRAGQTTFRHLDAAQLVKHAFGLVTEARRRALRPVLFYLFAEPKQRGDRPVLEGDRERHRDEVGRFGHAVAGDEVLFLSSSYREWIAHWTEADTAAHGAALLNRFAP